MRIAFIVGFFPALSATFIQDQATGLIELGHDVQIFAGKNPNEEKVHPDFLKYRLNERVRYFAIPKNKIVRFLKAAFLFLVNFHKSPRKLLKSLDVFKFGKPALSLNLIYYLVPFLGKRNKFDVIHCHFGPNGIIGAYLKELGISGKLVTTFYGYDLTYYIREKGTDVYRRLFARGALFLPICDYFKRKLIQYGCDAAKTQVHTIGIDLEKYGFSRKTYPPQQGQVNILTIGRMCEKKGFVCSIKAFALARRKHKNIRYILAGDGPLRKNLEILVAELGIQDAVEFTGSIDREELLALYEKSHIFMLASVTAQDGDQEGTPTVLLEAQAAGLPVISTQHSGIPEIIADGESGYLVPEKDITALAERLDYLVSHPDSWPKLGKKGRAFVEKHFDLKTLNCRLIEYYE